MKIFGLFVGKSKRLMALVIVLVLLASAVGVAASEAPESEDVPELIDEKAKVSEENCEIYCKEKFEQEKPAFLRLFKSYGTYPFCYCTCMDERTADVVICWKEDWDCEEYCSEMYKNKQWDSLSEWPDCRCICKQGYEEREKEGCVLCNEICKICKRKGGVHYIEDKDKSEPNSCACKCEDGYDDSYSEKCEKVECPENATNVAELGGSCPKDRKLNRHCCCNPDYVQWYRRTCLKIVSPPRSMTPDRLVNLLGELGYKKGNCPPVGNPPNGSVNIWGNGAHTSVVINDKSTMKHIEMGHKEKVNPLTGSPMKDPRGKSIYESDIVDTVLQGKTNTPYPSQETYCPPPGSTFDKSAVMAMKGIERNFRAGRPDEWNCHGFTAILIYRCVDTGLRMKPGTVWEFRHMSPLTLVLKKGTIYVNRPLNRSIPIATAFGKMTAHGEYTIEVRDDQTAIIHVIDGKVDYQDADYEEVEHTLSLSSGQMGVIDPTGTPLPPTTFNISEMDLWWTKLKFLPETSQETEGLTFESHSKPSGSSVQIPLTLNGIEDKIGNMDITLSYDPSVLEATEVTKGALTTDSLFEYNIMAGTILISLADAEGFSGNGSIAYVTFNVTGAEGSTSPLQIAAIAANRAEDYKVLTIPTNDGVFRVIFISTDERGGLTVSVSDTTGAKGSTVEVPINLEGATEVGSMDIVLNYDAEVLSAVDVEAGELGKNALIESNTAKEGEVIIALADSSGIDGDGTVASVTFEVIGDAGTTSPLTLEEVLVHNLDLGEIIPNTVSGTFLVI